MPEIDIKQTLISVLKTLDQVQVTGRLNMDKMLGCMIALEKVVASISEPTTLSSPEEDDGK